ncbi:MAG: peptidoglycan-binding protein [Candidatus Thiodiazotropha taylori]|nr:peptidoglycan-binding protein [Candidatus Thiodiazotropha taylori]MCG8092618.1 peptidoglycan-binding protein [Candidatus Thiodiazotropha endolucinida]MCG8109508.1 peptidoglycan-binding protein [Candidatus Thiodiazotropha taylori]MCW4281849.1 peptidoglycan-binding protein [Candidatus Thiodiazotropha taylori]MCW4305957.1 peptidoglycan-binding protein [Candidatus Thiodiazotropha taylori]
MSEEYNHKKQIVFSICLGIIIGSGATRFYYDGGFEKLVESSKENIESMPDLDSLGSDRILGIHVASEDWKTRVSDKDICELQTRLHDKGFYDGGIDGEFGRLSSIAISKYESNLKRNETGFPSFGVLKSLRTDKNTNERYIKLPYNGQIFNASSKDRKAPLTIKTSRSGAGYLVKLVNVSTQIDELIFFIKAGDSVSLDVPFGTYNIKYASGSRWLGQECLFGSDTVYSKTDKSFTFKESDGRVSGYTIELILQSRGNLKTRNISKSSW